MIFFTPSDMVHEVKKHVGACTLYDQSFGEGTSTEPTFFWMFIPS